NGKPVKPDGATSKGWMADPSGKIDLNKTITDLTMPPGEVIPPSQSHTVKMGGNLPSDAAPGTLITASITVYDEQGTAVPLVFDFTKQPTANTWIFQAVDANGSA